MSEEVKSKPVWLSKTLWVNVLAVVAILVAQFSPEAAEFIKSHFAEIGGGWAVLNTILRLVSKDQLYLS